MSFAHWFSDIPTHVLVAVPLVVLFAYTIFGATGFGSSIISVPALAHYFPLTFTVPLITTIDAFAATATTIRLHRKVAWGDFLQLLPALLIGMTLGATLLVNLPPAPALLALGAFASLYGIYVLTGAHGLTRAPTWLAWPVGMIGGVFSALFGTGGPIYMVFLAARIHDKAQLRATAALIVALSVWIRLLLFVATGLLLDPRLLAFVVVLLPLMIIGLRIGNRLHDALSGRGMLRLIAALLLANGVSLIVRAIGSLQA